MIITVMIDLTTMERLGFAAEDARCLLRAMPPAEQLEPHRASLAAGLAHRSKRGDGPPPKPPTDPAVCLYTILASIPEIRECHRVLGVADDISWETLAHLGRTERVNGGVTLTFWEWLRYSGWLYQVGRLEATVLQLRLHPKEAGPLFWYDDETAARLGIPARVGDPALSIHVPANEALSPDACDASIARMRSGFAGRHLAVCTSWLLDDQLAEYLPAESNIITFQQRFQLVPDARDDDEFMLRWVFGANRPASLDVLPRDTTLQRAIVDHLRAGRHWRLRTGWMAL